MKNKKDLGIYIHIPFCKQKCIYCDFLSGRADDSTKESYVKALLNEIKNIANIYKATIDDYKVRTVFFGGGTPSVINADYIKEIMECLYNTFDVSKNAEITIECNPGTLDKVKADTYKSCGINRISFGLQSTDNNELKMLGRIHTFEKFKESLSIARQAGFDNINVDIMSALPGQTYASYKRTLENVIACDVEHISAYSLIVEENTPLYDKLDTDYQPLPDEDTEREMYYCTEQLLGNAGFNHYEISNYAKPNYECKHNLSYWERTDYLGFGIGAASLFEEIRHTNIADRDKYIRLNRCELDFIQGDYNILNKSDMDNVDVKKCSINYYKSELWEEESLLSVGEQMEEFMFLGLRKLKGIEKSEFKLCFGVDIYEVYGEVIEQNVNKGLLTDKGDRICLTDRGIDISNTVMADFMI